MVRHTLKILAAFEKLFKLINFALLFKENTNFTITREFLGLRMRNFQSIIFI